MVNLAFLLFVQHGWADDNRVVMQLARRLVTDTTPIFAPNLGYIQTWMRITPLIQVVEKLAGEQVAKYPEVPLKIVGHSMGGLIWLEVLHRHPEWWYRVHSLVLIASPVGGADLARAIDPLNWGIGIAGDLGKNRKPIAAAIASVIPTLVIAGDIDRGSDGTVPVESTKFQNARFICLPGLAHAALRNYPTVAATIQDFWLDANVGEAIVYDDVVQRLQAVPGMTDGHRRDFERSRIAIALPNGATIRTYKNLFGIDCVFVASPTGECLYAGFVGWLHAPDLQTALADIQQAYCID